MNLLHHKQLLNSFPFPRAGIDLDFVNQRYWWEGVLRKTSEFTTYTPDGSFNQYGFVPASTVNWTISLAGLSGTYVPGSALFGFRPTSTPGATRTVFQLDDGTANERVSFLQQTTNLQAIQVVDGGVQQAFIASGGNAARMMTNYYSSTYATNNFLFHYLGFTGIPDTSGTLPTTTTLRIAKATGANTEALGEISRIILFTFAQTQGELSEIQNQLRFV